MITYAVSRGPPSSHARRSDVRRLFLLTILTALFCHAAHSQQKSDRESEGLRGPVKSFGGETVTEYEGPEEGKPRPRRRRMQSPTFNEKGNEVSRLFYNEDGSLAWTQTHTYNAAGRRAESVLTDTESHLLLKEVYTYDAGSRLVEKLVHNPPAPAPLKEKYSYDERGRVSEIAESFQGRGGAKRKYKYDEQGRVAVVSYYLLGKPFSSPQLIYPFSLCFGAHKVAYRYGAGALPAEIQCIQPDGRVMRTRTFVYNDKGDVVEEKDAYSPESGSRRTSTYEYDARGNWTKRETLVVHTYAPNVVEHSREDRVETTRRTITYF